MEAGVYSWLAASVVLVSLFSVMAIVVVILMCLRRRYRSRDQVSLEEGRANLCSCTCCPKRPIITAVNSSYPFVCPSTAEGSRSKGEITGKLAGDELVHGNETNRHMHREERATISIQVSAMVTDQRVTDNVPYYVNIDSLLQKPADATKSTENASISTITDSSDQDFVDMYEDGWVKRKWTATNDRDYINLSSTDGGITNYVNLPVLSITPNINNV